MNFSSKRGGLFSGWWRSVDKFLVFGILALLTLGIFLVMAASPAVATRIGLSYFHFVQRQVIYIFIGLLVMFYISLINPVAIRRLAILGFVGFFILLIGVEFFGYETKGAKRWIYLFGFSIQPSELLKPFFTVLTAWLISRRHIDKNFPGFTISIIFFTIICILLLRQPNFGMTLTFGVIWFTQMIIGGLNIFIIVGLGAVAIAGIFAAYNFLPHVQNRINTFLNTSEAGDNYQTEKSLQAFHNGGIFGRGPGEGSVKETIPDAHTDFIFAVAAEEYGLILCLIIMAVYAFIVFRCLYRAYGEKDLFTMLAVIGLSTQLFFQAIVNMGVASNMLPNTGMTLPFVSYGGSSMLSISVVVGMILCFTKKRFG